MSEICIVWTGICWGSLDKSLAGTQLGGSQPAPFSWRGCAAERGMHRTGSAGLWGQSLGRGRDGQCHREPEQDRGCQAACALHQLWFSAVPGSWDIELSCLVTILRDKEPGRSPKGHPASVQGSPGPRVCPGTHGQERGHGGCSHRAPSSSTLAKRRSRARAAAPAVPTRSCSPLPPLRCRSQLRSHGCLGCGSDLETPNPLYPRTQRGLSLQVCTCGHRSLCFPAWGCHRT